MFHKKEFYNVFQVNTYIGVTDIPYLANLSFAFFGTTFS